MRTREGLSALVCALLACTPFRLPAQSTDDATGVLSVVGDARVHVAPQALAENVFTVRLVDAQGTPMPGIVVEFGIAGGCSDRCSPPQIYGHFNDGTLEQPERVATDADGRATAHAFTGGAAAGLYVVEACAVGLVTGGAALCVDFTVHQVALGATLPITAGFSGAWYDPNQSGHGLFVEVLPENRLLAYWFAFDPDGAGQSWFGGVGAIDDDVAVIYADTGSGGAWIPNFDPARYARQPWGTLTFQFTDCNHGRVDFAGQYAATAYGIGHMDLTRVTLPAGLRCD
jgi:hypothetical protein